jgi:hypothetical protein
VVDYWALMAGDGDSNRDRNRGARFEAPRRKGLRGSMFAGAAVDQVGDGVDAAA